MFYTDRPEVDDDARRESIDARRRSTRMRHWCMDCFGNTQPGSPCHIPEETKENDDGEE